MAELFESYASDFAQLQKSIGARLKVDLDSVPVETRRTTLRHAEAEVEEAGELLAQMQVEVQGFPQSVRERYLEELRTMQREFEQIQQTIRQHSRGSASGLPVDEYHDGDIEDQAPQRQRLLQGTALLEQGRQRLADSTRLALETEDVGANILQDLRRQREQIENSRDTVRGLCILLTPASRR